MAGGLIAAVPFSLRSYTRLEIAARLTEAPSASTNALSPTEVQRFYAHNMDRRTRTDESCAKVLH